MHLFPLEIYTAEDGPKDRRQECRHPVVEIESTQDTIATGTSTRQSKHDLPPDRSTE